MICVSLFSFQGGCTQTRAAGAAHAARLAADAASATHATQATRLVAGATILITGWCFECSWFALAMYY